MGNGLKGNKDYMGAIDASRMWSLHCPVCEFDSFTGVYQGPDRYGIHIVLAECNNCGMVYIKNPPTDQREFYESGFYRELVGWYRGRVFDQRDHIQDQKDYTTRLFSWMPKVMESPVAHIGSDPHWHDPVADVLKENGIAPVESVDDWSSWATPVGSNNTILVCRTIDHLINPKAALTKCYWALAPSGLLYVDLFSGWLTEEDPTIVDTTTLKIDHPCYFTAITLGRLLRDIGFHLVQAGQDVVDKNHYSYLVQKAPK